MRVQGIKRQYEFSWDMLNEVFDRCPDRVWRQEKIKPYSIGRLAYHIIVSTQRYCRPKRKAVELDPFNLGRGEGEDVPMDRFPGIADVRGYSDKVRKRVMKWFDSLRDSELSESDGGFTWTGETIGERLVYTLKHFHHHLGQMNLLLRQHGSDAVEWKCRR